MTWWGNYQRVVLEPRQVSAPAVDRLTVLASAEGAASTGRLRLVVRAAASLSAEPCGSSPSVVCKELFVPAAP